ncbi:hypothetical protein SDRG_07385 [Saprolegnia diclina VS20]|uniref:Sfi1 spindle body domain-containing protein n=1 Tax=Saprolegnia diclina (strain VS20) TaxID=1156394 RepID=T0RRN9_SAPDV|nr:hypothetical protein SDRG_07385 [Saprolegnia diclina VS20]EQC35153.1 hypothetical protein SDRG_07385 [Saprolegnia diclina VS20]|eukprot:XP_008611437.1 hypothetical protein SDRG_07385 [Saprolegnia diclina VS20]
MLAWRQLMARKEAQIIALLSLRLRQGIARWRERHHARRYVAHQASLVLSAQLQRRKLELVEIGQWLQHKAATTRHRRILHHWYGHCVAQQLQQVSRMRAVAHHRRRLSRQLPVAVFQWRSWTLDAVAVQALRAATIEAHHRFHQRRAMLKAWQCVCRIARRARAWNDARLWRQCRHMLQAWRVLVRRQMYISSVVHLFENARLKSILQTTLHQWRTATAQLCSRRRSIDCFQSRRVRQAQDRVLRVWRCWVACRHHARNQALQCALHGERQRARSTWGTWRSRYRVISDRRQAIAALMQHHTRARLLRQFVNWQLWAAQRRHWQRCLDTRLHASWLLRTHFGAWSDHVDRRRFLASGVASLHTTWRHRQTRQVWCRWQKHRDELEATLSPATAVCQKAQRRKAWVHWRQAWHQRRAAHDAHLHVLRDALRGLWRQWHRYCLLQHEARTLVDQALDMASKHRKCRAWRRWLRYHAAKVAQRLWLARSTRHYLGFHCRIAIQKLSAHAYLSRLQVAVSRGSLRRSFAAWQRLVSELTNTRRRARQALFHMQHWRIRRGWCQWRLGHLRAHRQHHQEGLSTRQYVRHRLANGLGRWLCMLREKQQRRVRWLLADAHCSKHVLGMAWASWRHATALRKREQQQFHCARQFAVTRCLLRMWQHWHLWYRYRRTSTFRVMAVTRLRQHVWFRNWQRVTNAHHLARLHQTRRLGRLFTAWYDQTRYVLACRVQLAVAYDRLSLAARL